MANSKFALVPGGKSAETIRLYDALEHGAIPICLESDFPFSSDALGSIGTPPLVQLDGWSSLAKGLCQTSTTAIGPRESADSASGLVDAVTEDCACNAPGYSWSLAV
jgi:hypothetical protein